MAAGLDERSAGPSYSVRHLAQGLGDLGVDIDMMCVSGWRGQADDTMTPAPRRFRQDAAGTPILGQACLSSEMHAALKAEAAGVDVLHAHGLWLMPDIYPAWVARAAGKPFVLSPRGMLGDAALKFSGLRKTLAWSLLQGPAARTAGCLHATSAAEHDEIRARGLTNPVAVIPNGVMISPATERSSRDRSRTLLTLGRIHPKKGLANLVSAWATIEAKHPDWRLRMVGADEVGHARELRDLADRLGARRLSIEAPVFGDDKARVFADADLFVLPTLNENFALTVAEALAAGRPVIASKGAPWAGLEEKGCGWWIDIGVEPLSKALDLALSLPRERLDAMGENGRAWMSESFSWAHVAREMLAVYRWLTGAGPAPESVRFA